MDEMTRQLEQMVRDGLMTATGEDDGSGERCVFCASPRDPVTVLPIEAYLKDSETPAECIARNRHDVDIALGELARTKLRAESAEADRDRLQRDLETEQLRLAACSVAALSNLPEKWDGQSARLEPGHPYYSASYGDVCRAVDREIAERDRADRLQRELDKVQATRDVNAAWREGAELAGHAQPLPSIEERWRGRSPSEIAALERGFVFIHNSDVAKEMTRRIHVVAERASADEFALTQIRQALQKLMIDANRLCDRQLGGTYEDDCRRSIIAARSALSVSGAAEEKNE